MFKKISILAILFLVFIVNAESYNWKSTIFKFKTFRADSTKYTPTFSLSDNENFFVVARVNDTTQAGYASDSVNFYYGIQYGRITVDYQGNKDTSWSNPWTVIDTVRFAAANFKTPTSNSTVDTLQPLAIDTGDVSGLAENIRSIQPYRYQLARIVTVGVTGNKKASYLRYEVEIGQCLYSRVNIGQSNQPNEENLIRFVE
jgi:hypothetical protein